MFFSPSFFCSKPLSPSFGPSDWSRKSGMKHRRSLEPKEVQGKQRGCESHASHVQEVFRLLQTSCPIWRIAVGAGCGHSGGQITLYTRAEQCSALFCLAGRRRGKQKQRERGNLPTEGKGGREPSYADATSVLAAHAPLAAALEAIPAEDWWRTWATGRTIVLRRTSKRVEEVVDKMCLPAIVRLSRSFRDDARDGTAAEKLQFVIRQLQFMTAWCRIITLELPSCGIEWTRCREACRSAGAVPSAGSPRSPLQ